MIYEESRQQIASGDVLAWTHRPWRSWYDFQVQMVRMFTRSEYCHVAIAWKCGGRLFVIEAVSSGVRIFPLSRLIPFYWIPIKLNWTDNVEQFALSKVGDPYSKLRAIGAYFGWIKQGAGTYLECAEYVLMVLKQAGKDYKSLATPTAVVSVIQSDGAATYMIDD